MTAPFCRDARRAPALEPSVAARRASLPGARLRAGLAGLTGSRPYGSLNRFALLWSAKPMTILIIEDNVRLAANLRDLLQLEGHAVAVAHDGEEGLRRGALRALRVHHPRPQSAEAGRAGSLSPAARGCVTSCRCPILMLTARGSKTGRRHRARHGRGRLPRRSRSTSRSSSPACARFSGARRPSGRPCCARATSRSTPTRTRCSRTGGRSSLAPREYALLEHLLRNKGVVQDRLTLLEQVWGESDALLFSQTVDVHVSYLRRKLGQGPRDDRARRRLPDPRTTDRVPPPRLKLALQFTALVFFLMLVLGAVFIAIEFTDVNRQLDARLERQAALVRDKMRLPISLAQARWLHREAFNVRAGVAWRGGALRERHLRPDARRDRRRRTSSRCAPTAARTAS